MSPLLDVTQVGFAAATGTLTGLTVELPAQQYDGGHMDWGDGGWIVMASLMTVFWLGVLGVAAWGIATFARRDSHPSNALGIARQRFARGEITAEELQKIRETLR